jgi:hypothetical protein
MFNMNRNKLLDTILRFLDNKPFIDDVIYKASNQYKFGAVVVFTEKTYRVIYGDKLKLLYNPDNALCVSLPYWDWDYQEFYDIIQELMEKIIDELDRQKYFTKVPLYTPQWILDIYQHGKYDPWTLRSMINSYRAQWECLKVDLLGFANAKD